MGISITFDPFIIGCEASTVNESLLQISRVQGFTVFPVQLPSSIFHTARVPLQILSLYFVFPHFPSSPHPLLKSVPLFSASPQWSANIITVLTMSDSQDPADTVKELPLRPAASKTINYPQQTDPLPETSEDKQDSTPNSPKSQSPEELPIEIDQAKKKKKKSKARPKSKRGKVRLLTNAKNCSQTEFYRTSLPVSKSTMSTHPLPPRNLALKRSSTMCMFPTPNV